MMWRTVLAGCALVAAFFGAPAQAYAQAKLDPNILTEAHFIKFQPIIMSVVQDRQVKGLVQLEVTLKLEDPNERRDIVKERHRIKDKLIQAIAGMTRGAIRVDAPINLEMVAAVLQRHVDVVLDGKKSQVLILDASTRAQ